MNTPSLVLEAHGLRKRFDRKQAVDGVDIAVAAGEVVGFLGPNGAGKTTVLNMIAGIVEPDEGELKLFGSGDRQRRRAMRSRMSFLQEKPRVYPEMSCRAYLRLFADLYSVPAPASRVDEQLELMSLTHAADRALSTFSRGMQQRACLARTMLHQPEFLVLDEPTLGLDPQGISDIRDVLLRLNRSGVALLFSSHQLAEMERICDRLVLMNYGKVVATGTKDEIAIRLPAGRQFAVEIAESSDAVLGALRDLPCVRSVTVDEIGRLIVGWPPEGDLDVRATRITVSKAITQAGGIVMSIGAKTLTLEEAFLQITQGHAGEPSAPQTRTN